MSMNQNTASHIFSRGVYKSSLDSKSDVADVSTKERANEMWITGWPGLHESHLFNHLNGTLQVLNELDTIEHNFLKNQEGGLMNYAHVNILKSSCIFNQP